MRKFILFMTVAASVVQSSYTAAEWATVKEQYGLVALPFAGDRNGSSLSSTGSYGYYWLSTPYSGIEFFAWYASFNPYGASMNFDNRNNGRPVRLVSVQ